MAIYTLKYNGTEKTFADWGLRGGVRVRQSQSASVVTFQHVVESIGQNPIFAHKSKVEIYKQPTDAGSKFRWFVGWVAKTPLSGRGARSSHTYELRDAWWFLERLVFQRLWYRAVDPADPESSLEGGFLPWVILNNGINGEYLKTDAMFAEIVNYVNQSAIDQGVGAILQLAPGFPAVEIPKDEKKNILCAQAAQLQMRWIGDATTWIDYNTEPPTLHCLRRGDQTAVDIPAADIPGTEVTPRDDLKVPGIIIKYERTNQVDGKGRLETVTDAFPADVNDRLFDAIPFTIELGGWEEQYQTAEIETRPISVASTGVDPYLFTKLPTLNDERIYPATFAWNTHTWERSNGSVFNWAQPSGPSNQHPGQDMTRELVSGTITPGEWQLVGGGNVAAAVEPIVAKGVVRYDKDEGNGEVTKVLDKQISFRFNLTNLPSGTYRRMVSWQEADPIPQGLAESLFNAYSVTHYEGTLRFVADSAPDSPGLGNVVNITGDRAEWATMRALVQSEREDMDRGEKTVTIGPPSFLSASDMTTLLFVTRSRASWTAPRTVQTGEASAKEQQNPKFAATENTTVEGGGVPKFHVSSAFWTKGPTGNWEHQSGYGFMDVSMDGHNRQFRMKQTRDETINGQPSPAANSEVVIDLFDASGKSIRLRKQSLIVAISWDATNKRIRFQRRNVLVMSEDAAGAETQSDQEFPPGQSFVVA